MNRTFLLAAAGAALVAAPVAAQTSSTTSTTQSTARDRLGQILGNIFGATADASLEAQWRLGRKPLAAQRTQFETRVDADVRAGTLSSATGVRLKSDYAAVVEMETRFGADGQFTTSEREQLSDRYGALTQVLSEGGYADGATSTSAEVAAGRAAFDARVDAAVAARKLTRVNATKLKADYAALVTVESGYLRDGTLSAREKGDLDARLDALDERVGDTGYGTATAAATAKSRLAAIASAVPSAGLTAAARAQLLVEHGDLVRLEAAYARTTPSAADTAYLDSRIANLETRANVRR